MQTVINKDTEAVLSIFDSEDFKSMNVTNPTEIYTLMLKSSILKEDVIILTYLYIISKLCNLWRQTFLVTKLDFQTDWKIIYTQKPAYEYFQKCKHYSSSPKQTKRRN